MQKPNRKLLITYTILIIFISIAVYKVLMQIHAVNFELLSGAAHGVLDGKPHWKAYQNRILGPYCVYFISMMGISYSSAMKIYILLMIILQNILFFSLIQKTRTSLGNSLAWVIIYSFFFILVQHRWFYTWDNIDAIIFTLFTYGIFKSKPMCYFVILFCVGILNRETALFIALYIAIDSFHFKSITKFYLISTKKLITGGCLILFGIIYTKAIRDFLFIGNPDAFSVKHHELMDNHIYFSKNIEELFYNNIFTVNIINSAFILGSIIYFMYSIKSYVDSQIKALLIYCVIVTNILIFGLINETRTYIILIPFIVFLIISKENLTFTSIQPEKSKI